MRNFYKFREVESAVIFREFSNDACIIRFTGMASVEHFRKLCEAVEIAAIGMFFSFTAISVL